MSAPESPAPLLRVERVSKSYAQPSGGFQRRVPDGPLAVDDVSFDLAPGQTLGVVGESGSGKSTLARLLVLLDRPTSGTIYYEGRDVATFGRAERLEFRRHVQMVFQDPFTSLNPTMTVGDLVCEPWRVHRSRPRRDQRAAAVELLDSVGLGAPYYDRRPRQLSGGERQRVGIARALALDPQLLICDEPVSALDVSVQSQILQLFEQLQRTRGLAVLFISHDLSVVRYLAHRVAVMYRGQLVEIDDRDRLYANPSHPYTQSLLAASHEIHGEATTTSPAPAKEQ